MSYSLGAALIGVGVLMLPALVARTRTTGVRRGAFATRPNGIPLFLEADQGSYQAVARVCYRLPRGPLSARFRLTLLKQSAPVWTAKFMLEESNVNRGAIVERQVTVGHFDVESDGQYVMRVEPEGESDPRVQVASVELFGQLPRPHRRVWALGHVCIVAGLATVAVRATLG